MPIEAGDVYVLEKRLDRVQGYGPDKVAFSDYYPIEKRSKVTVLRVEGEKALVRFERRTWIAVRYVEDKGVQWIETDALYDATDINSKSRNGLVALQNRISLLLNGIKRSLIKS